MSMINNTQSLAIHGGVFTQHNSLAVQSLSQSAFERLQKEVAPGAFHNSGERFDPPKCHPRTRVAVIERIMNWVLWKERTNSLVLWLNGAAGAGKSAIAQKIAELCYEAEILLASFFFSRSDPHRNHPKALFATLSYQIACAIPEARLHLEQEISRDPLIFTRSLEAQMVALIVKPLQSLVDSSYFSDPTSPRLIILDGIDEIMEQRSHSKILQVISDIFHRHRMPFIFLVVSRPEQEITFAFNSQPLSELTDHLRLDNTFHPDDDIRLFINDSFSEIKTGHPRKKSIPPSWPSEEVIDALVHKASGQFIYAATVIRFIESIRHRPMERLDIILGLRPVHRDLPFAELDALYMHILSALDDPERTLLVIGLILVRAQFLGHHLSRIPDIERFLGLEAGDVEFLLADMASLVSWEVDGTQIVQMLHASFGDFLFDHSRSGTFSLERKALHAVMAYQCCRNISCSSDVDTRDKDWLMQYPTYAVRNMAYHLNRSELTPELMSHLTQLSFEQLIEDASEHLSLYPEQGRFTPGSIYDTWLGVIPLADRIRPMMTDDSEFYRLRQRFCDDVIKREFDLFYANQPSLYLLLSLTCVTPYRHLSDFRWTPASVAQLTDWNKADHQKVIDLFRLDIFPHSASFYTDIFPGFLQDVSRAGKYTVTAETFARASLKFLEYLSRSRLGALINLRHTPRNLTSRRNRPWHWRKHMRYLDLGARKGFKFHSRFDFTPTPWLRDVRQSHFPKLYFRLRRQQTYINATYIALKSFPKLLRRSAASDQLIASVTAEKPFSQRALQYPALVKQCKAAMVTYVARVQ
ncbi:hypothetical protein HYPSUDRAFT_42181 [Hypholoma sublateritium FD-334 SS-4]|uniref:NACHT domain-containing protein n=1 Tax=Hypholoma sublateritium (strain FD-334 SS-4) TaxID=945553 RepID=A0A0D2PN64_HYPSF|nr:hypothetical protein HYPSUDRAFT_42181 [Hypholoma sublateritium FD-334 SS-4]